MTFPAKLKRLKQTVELSNSIKEIEQLESLLNQD